ncbi:SusC/RagA family TonB-linked outer membrane protein [Butyricimonas paravirosa]|uniref:SusC/RagA family TonB-linked outer membrane protein n=1 Tax=Butyricimonas paravirosa TaxID=1472417 RepID=UPI0022E92593|nr:SusC/RagA family TonB-linked outer membrane protein [Butyricimonas paravirosa]
MKLTFLMMCAFVFSLSAGVRAQDQMVTLKVEGMPFAKVISELKRQTQLDFFYSFDEVDVKQTISLNVKNTKIDKVLQQMFGDKFTWEYIDRMVIIKPATPDEPEKKSLRVKGFVYDKEKQPMPGVTVKVVGLTIGTATNGKGWFAMDLPLLKGVLEFSFVGYKKQQVNFTEKTDTLRIVLVEDVSDLDEVVVRAYGSQNKRELVGALSTVTSGEMKELPAASITSMLQGRLAGVNVTMQSGAPGSAPVVAVRGYNSLLVDGASDGQPLWVVDGVPMHSFVSPITGTNTLSDLDPSMIESVTVLKDAAAASIYGSRAGNGVILVTTKKGQEGQTKFSANVSYTASQLMEWPSQTGGRMERWLDIQNARNKKSYYTVFDWSTLSVVRLWPTTYEEVYGTTAVMDYFWQNGDRNNDLLSTVRVLQDSLDPYYNNVQNWWKYVFHTGKIVNVNIQASGGSKKFQYMVGAGFYDEKGIMINSAYSRFNLRSNLTAKLTEKLRLDTRIYLSYVDRTMNKSGSVSRYEGMEIDPQTKKTYEAASKELENEWLASIKEIRDRTDDYRLMASMYFEYNLLEGLSLSAAGNVDYSQANMNRFTPSTLDAIYNENSSSGSIGRVVALSTEELLRYNVDINEKHHFELLLGVNANKEQHFSIGGSGNGGASDKVYYYDPSVSPSVVERPSGKWESLASYDSDFTEKIMVSYLGRFVYNYKQRYLMEFTFRRDGSSTFGEGNRWANFPSIAAGWTFSEEPFIKGFTGHWLNWGKIRGSYGTSGQIFTDAYMAYGLMKINSGILDTPLLFDGNPTVSEQSPVSPDLTWEKTEQYDIGLDMDMFDYRLKLKMDYYYKYTSSMIYGVGLPSVLYNAALRTENAMAVSNEGLELELQADILREGAVSWRTKFNIARNWNRLEKTSNNKDTDKNVIGRPISGIYVQANEGFYESDEDVPYYYSTDGDKVYWNRVSTQSATSGLVGNYKVTDRDGAPTYSREDNYFAGSTLPLVHGGWVNEIRWKNFDLSMLVNYVLGRRMINQRWETLNTIGGKYFDYRDLRFWTELGCDANVPAVGYSVRTTFDTNIEKANYLSLKQLTVGYNLSDKLARKIGLSGVRIFATGENLFYWSSYSGENPEVVDLYSGLDSGTAYPLPRKWTLGLTVNF